MFSKNQLYIDLAWDSQSYSRKAPERNWDLYNKSVFPTRTVIIIIIIITIITIIYFSILFTFYGLSSMKLPQ